jgi:hypothetical protein
MKFYWKQRAYNGEKIVNSPMQTFGLFEQLVQEYFDIRSFNFNAQEHMPKIYIICP